MHQTFYIDIDEEVNSVISRIRKSNAKYNILVIAQGALLMQSSVSLKLIKREADNLEKKMMIITKDERAAAIASKIGFSVRKSLEEVSETKTNSIVKKENVPTIPAPEKDIEPEIKETAEVINKKNRLVNLGSDSFISTDGMIKKTNLGENLRSSLLKGSKTQEEMKSDSLNNISLKESPQDNFKKLFTQPVKEVVRNKDNLSTKKILKFLWIFVVFIGILLLGIGAYFYLPKAEIKVFPLKKSENINLGLDISETATPQDKTIALSPEIVEDEGVLALTFDASGQKGESNQKAKGVITIYNEFSETSQVLVATTRFLSNGDKLFRLLETVTVPGMIIKDGKVEAGKIEANIVADEAGTEFNIKEAEFKIPGLKGSPKYDKFYAKLTQETKGGGSSESNLKAVAKSDIESAKFKTENQLKAQLKENIKNKLGQEYLLLDNAVAYEVVDFSIFPEEGAVTENFEYQVKIKIKALSFSVKELDEKIITSIDAEIAKEEVTMEVLSFEKNYGNADIDFAKKTIKMEVSVNAKLKAKIDKDKLAQSLAGKKKDEMGEIISTFPEINKVEAIISPDFISNNFPKYPSKIKIEISND